MDPLKDHIRRCIDAGLVTAENGPMIQFLFSKAGLTVLVKEPVGKKNWNLSATKAGASSSAILYSIAETSKANGLKPYEYFKYILEQILEHVEDPPSEYIDELMLWSESLPDKCRREAKN